MGIMMLHFYLLYKQLNKIKANGEKTFKPLDKAPPKRNCPLHNFLVLNERFHKVMTKCLLPEDFGLVEFSQEFMDGIGIGHSLETGSDMRLLWTRVTSAFRTFMVKYQKSNLELKRQRLAQHILREIWDGEEEKLDAFIVSELSKKTRGRRGKKGLWKNKMKLLVSKKNLFEHMGKKYLTHKSKLQMGKQWLLYTYQEYAPT